MDLVISWSRLCRSTKPDQRSPIPTATLGFLLPSRLRAHSRPEPPPLRRPSMVLSTVARSCSAHLCSPPQDSARPAAPRPLHAGCPELRRPPQRGRPCPWRLEEALGNGDGESGQLSTEPHCHLPYPAAGKVDHGEREEDLVICPMWRWTSDERTVRPVTSVQAMHVFSFVFNSCGDFLMGFKLPIL